MDQSSLKGEQSWSCSLEKGLELQSQKAGAQKDCAGEVAGNLGPDTETVSIPGVRADGHRAELGGAAAFWHGKADPVQYPRWTVRYVRKAWPATTVKPRGSLSTLYLKTQPVTAAYPLISYLGKNTACGK